MPYIELKTNVKIDDAKAKGIREMLGREIELIPGKSEKWLMTGIADGVRMSHGGSDEPCALVTVSIFGKASAEAYDALTASLCEKLSDCLGVAADRIYVKYEEVSVWGWNGMNF
ncbi:MAG: hypothetical protein IKM46_06180 [Clostridia bacterium]|nr:hypothetical protein [Clostridia bacterium]